MYDNYDFLGPCLSVQVIESFSTLHLVMECAGEGDLQARIAKEGPLTEDQARHIFAQVTAAIHHMVGTKQLTYCTHIL